MPAVYKYLSPERVDVLRDARIRYTQPACFNEPFESKPVVAALPTPEEIEAVGRIEVARLGTPEEDVSGILRIAADPIEFRAVLDLLLDVIGRTVGILSLTEKPDNLLMWAHYAANHTVYAIGLDANHPHWNRVQGHMSCSIKRSTDLTSRRSILSRLNTFPILIETRDTARPGTACTRPWRKSDVSRCSVCKRRASGGPCCSSSRIGRASGFPAAGRIPRRARCARLSVAPYL